MEFSDLLLGDIVLEVGGQQIVEVVVAHWCVRLSLFVRSFGLNALA